MKISNIIKITSVTFLIVSVLGCKKYLKETNPSGLTAEAVYSTPEGYRTLVNGAYSYLRWWYGKEEGYGMAEMGTDLWTSGEQGFNATSGTSNEVRSLVMYDNLNPTNGSITRNWKHLYAAVNLCNTGIKLFEDGSSGSTPQQAAELKFLRAFYNWHIVETWGGVHLTTEPTSEATLTANRSSEEAFYALIIEDLKFAKTNLSSTGEFGRATKSAAQALLARVYLTRGYKDASLFESAIAEANEVINSGFTLEPRYKDLWTMNRVSKEVIWGVNYSTNLAISDNFVKATYPYGYGYETTPAVQGNRGQNNGHLFFTSRYDITAAAIQLKIGVNGNALAIGSHWPLVRDVNYGWSFNRYMPTKHLLSLFDETRDSRYYGSFQTVWLANRAITASSAPAKFALKDTALVVTKGPKTSTKYYTFDAYSLYNADGGSAIYANNQIYPNLIKFRDSTRNITSPGNPLEGGNGSPQSSRDVFVFRVAEMYMIVAEANVNLGRTTEAATAVNFVRRRAGGSAFEVGGGDMTIDFILDERAREFAGEQIRWFDLKRTGKLVERAKLYNPDIRNNIAPTHVLRPIPRSQLDAVTNKSEFTQNPGYN